MKSSLMQKQEYSDMYHTEDDLWWYVGLRQTLVSCIDRYSKSGATILDAGCGTGKTMHVLHQKGYKVTGIDMSDEALKLSQKRGNKQIQKSSVTTLPFPNNSFDVVICMDVLGCLQTDTDVSKAFQEFHRVLKPGGLLVVQCAALEWLRSPHDIVTNIRKRFTKNEIQTFINAKQWYMIKISYRMFLLFLPILLTKLRKQQQFQKGAHAQTDQGVPPHFINKILLLIQSLENFLLQFINFPIGSSIFVVARKK